MLEKVKDKLKYVEHVIVRAGDVAPWGDVLRYEALVLQARRDGIPGASHLLLLDQGPEAAADVVA